MAKLSPDEVNKKFANYVKQGIVMQEDFDALGRLTGSPDKQLDLQRTVLDRIDKYFGVTDASTTDGNVIDHTPISVSDTRDGSPPDSGPTRNTEYDPTYTPPTMDPEAQKGLTDMLGRFGIDYPNAPRATPQLLAFMRGLGMSMDTLEDVSRQQQSKAEGRSADSMADINRNDQRTQQQISAVQQSRNVLSSGATNSKFARQAQDVVAAQSDVLRTEADTIGDIRSNLAMGQDNLRLTANERVIDEETRQANADATAQEQIRNFNQQQTETDFQNAEAQAARDEYIKQQQALYQNVGLGV